jgi:hypothetical protein
MPKKAKKTSGGMKVTKTPYSKSPKGSTKKKKTRY